MRSDVLGIVVNGARRGELSPVSTAIACTTTTSPDAQTEEAVAPNEACGPLSWSLRLVPTL